ncbi:chorismate--pyruvate lyase family protein [Marinomonas sp. IMCC 4694]|uniref:chorismate--pyruvate lyase family protein n=1 Tax=Marinomonas sp. IMCC 4694 TaxID=2605432 RepID=UPI0011E62214|nr:chorismate lyase [Marinomonas sp. IMCC 4694]TYL49266.1 chorismate lyase [Marinomonas sp. IMCC 4694]
MTTLMNPSAAQQFDYRWSPVHRINKNNVPRHLWPWLVTQDSLTATLQSLGILTVDVLEDTWGAPTSRERRRLSLRPREAARIRTVLLRINGSAVIYARSVIPARSLRGHWRQVKQLKNTPLGGYLFQYRALRRSAIEVTQLPKRLFPNQASALWARRSVFHQYGPGILVNEAFFDDIPLKPPFGFL